jgi:predicted amidohydrolase
MNVATVAHDTIWQDIDANIQQTEKHVERVLELFPKTDIILFPEISLVGCVDAGNKEFAQSLDGEAVQMIKSIAKRYKVALICGIIEKNGDQNPYNCAFVVSKTGQVIASYRKNHLFTEGQEPDFYTPGETLTMFEFEGWRCGLSICFDIRFPRLFATYRQAGVEVMFSPNNWVDGRNKPAILENLVKARAHENQYFFAAVDRSGKDPSTTYYGVSVVSNPYAEDIARRSGLYSYAELDKKEIETLRSTLPLASCFKPEYKVAEA